MPSLSPELLKQILEEARFAPSGDNIQPWLFKMYPDHSLVLHRNEPENLLASDYFLNASFVALGCILENVAIASEHYGFSSTIVIHEDCVSDETPQATIHFIPTTLSAEQQESNEKLFKVMRKRHTDRRPYKKQPLDDTTKRLFEKTALEGGGKLHLIEGEEMLDTFGKTLGSHDTYLWNDATLRDNLIRFIHFSQSNHSATSGMPLDTLGLGTLSIFFKTAILLAYRIPLLWKVICFASRFGTQKTLSASSALVFLTLPKQKIQTSPLSDTPTKDLVRGGRIAERLWLLAETLGLSLQPQYAFVAMAHNAGNEKLGQSFLSANKKIIAFLRSHCPWFEKESLVFAYRIGFVTSSKRAPTTERKSVEEILWHT